MPAKKRKIVHATSAEWEQLPFDTKWELGSLLNTFWPQRQQRQLLLKGIWKRSVFGVFRRLGHKLQAFSDKDLLVLPLKDLVMSAAEVGGIRGEGVCKRE